MYIYVCVYIYVSIFFYFENVFFLKDDHSQEHFIFSAILRLEGIRTDFPINVSNFFCCFI